MGNHEFFNSVFARLVSNDLSVCRTKSKCLEWLCEKLPELLSELVGSFWYTTVEHGKSRSFRGLQKMGQK